MSDRCRMEVFCLTKDKEKFEELGFTEWPDKFMVSVWKALVLPASRASYMVDATANYAHAREMPEDIPYYGFNSAGDEYGPGLFVCDGKTFLEVGCLSGPDEPAVRVRSSGGIAPQAIRDARLYWRLLKRVKKQLGVT